MKNFCLDLKEHATKIINYEKKEIIPLTKTEKIIIGKKISAKKYQKYHLCKKISKTGDNNVRDHCHYSGKYRAASHNLFNLRYKIPKEIPVVFDNGSTYDCHFIIKELTRI